MIEDYDFEKEISNESYKYLYILRGIYGIGKTTFAKGLGGIIHSTNNYFKTKDGYKWSRELLAFFHKKNQEAARTSMMDGLSPIIIDNTNVCLWEMKPYVESGLVYNYKIRIVEFKIPFDLTPEILAKRTKHKVPINYIRDKIEKFEPFTCLEDVLNAEKPKGK